jgi:ribose transport system permease protein
MMLKTAPRPAEVPEEPVAQRAPRLASAAAALPRYALLLVAVAFFVGFSAALPSTYATAANVRSMLSTEAIPLLLTLAVLFPLRSGDFDLSVAANMVFCSALLGVMTTKHGLGAVEGVVLVLLVGTAVGALNAFFIVILEINAFIVTLGAMTVLDGLSFGITGGNVVVGLPPGLLSFGRDQVASLPLAVIYGWVLALVVWYVFELTPLGRFLLFVGGNRDAARLSGVPVRTTRFVAFAVSGLLSGFAGVILAARFGSVDPTVSASFLLPPYAAAFLGTTAVQIGRFNVAGSLIGAYLLIFGITGLLLEGAAPWVSDVFNGGALIAAVTFARVVGRRGEGG